MSLFDQINADLTTAMKAREKEKTAALRNIKKFLIEAKTASAAHDLDDTEVIKIIQKLAKQGTDSANLYKEQGREDLASEELVQVAVFEDYLPKKLTDEELTAAVQAIIESTGASSMKEMGKVMGIASKQLAGKADGKDVADKVKALLA
ncbi:GatB/YqeY domain-containing protein [Mangrovibacterium lignilyticum]|uniref:GatB/YqeY domain-containing protein n=1 Tax=Mangrovibacterium lignilyticum TaxID=2668052 RepID=UPI0013D3C98A|nr:GatB/YqeY domain-containing protein [Mangrovibacterium lignilyticum]